MPIDLPQNDALQRIDSWKQIAAFFGRDERTVKRWEKDRGLPVYRVPGGGRGTVYAYTEELTAWLRSPQQREGQSSASISDSSAAGNFGVATRGEGRASEGASPLLQGGSPTILRVRAGHSRTWWALGIVVAAVALVLAGFPEFFRLRSVLGHVLPSVSHNTESVAHKQAEDLYLQGRYHWNKRTPDGLTQALDDFTKSEQLDPNYALAYAGQADCYNLLREYTSMPASQAFPLAISAANKAVQLDDRLPEGHRALAFAYFYWNWDITGGEREFRRAIELNPKDVEAHHWYATALLTVARYPEALAEIQQARQLDPTSSSIAADRAKILYSAGREQESIQTLVDLEKSEPDFLSPYVYLAGEYFDRKEYLKSFEQAELAAKLSHDDKAIGSIEASRKRFKEGGEQAMLEGDLADQIQGFRQGNTKAIDVAKTYALLGKNKEAIEYLQKSYQRHEFELIAVLDWQGFRSLRPYPEYQDLTRHLGLNTPAA